MAVKIRTLDIEVPGKVVRHYDKDRDVTTLEVDSSQLTAINEELSEVASFLNSGQPSEPAATPTK